MKNLSILLLQFLVGINIVLPQSNSDLEITNYSVNDGLTSDEVYQVLKDSKGFMWFATDKGISKYDGNSFKTFGLKEGLPSPVIFWLAEGPDNRIWSLSNLGEISYIWNDSIHSFYNVSKHNLNDLRNTFNNFKIDSNGTLYITVASGRSISITQDKEVKISPKYLPNQPYKVELLNDNLILYSKTHYQDALDSNDNIYFYEKDSLLFSISQTDDLMQPTPNSIMNLVKTDEAYYLTLKKDIFKIKDGKILNSYTLPEDAVIKMYLDSTNHLWVGMYNNGVIQFNQDLEVVQHILSPFTISNITQDAKGNFWFSSLDHGVFYLPKLRLKKVLPGNINKLKLHDNKLNAIVNWNSFYDYSSGKFDEQYYYERIYFKDFVYHDNQLLFTFHRIQKSAIDQIKTNANIIASFNYGILPQKGSDQKLILTYNKLLVLEKADSVREIPIPYGRVRVLRTRDKYAILAIDKSIYTIDIETQEIVQFPYQFPTIITDINFYNNYSIICTRGAGVFIFKDNLLKRHLSVDNELLFSDYTSCITISGDTLWVGTNKGVDVIVDPIQQKNPIHFRISSKDGLFSDNITGICLFQDTAFIATSAGISKGSISKILHPNEVFSTFITQVNDQIVLDDSNSLEFNHNENDILFHFTSISYKKNQDLNYSIRIPEQDSQWVNIGASKTASINNLSPGTYTFQVKSFEKSKALESSQAVIACKTFVIQPAFWQTTFFNIIVISLLIGVVILIVWRREKGIREKNNVLIQKYELTHRALSAQMNPHFIYNALGSIQSIIVANDQKKALKYVANFANLMRRVLNSSDELFVPLQAEISTIEEYIKLEKLRFRQEFDFDWDIDPKIDKNTVQLPSMILQPFIENAIVHGLRAIKHKGIIEVIVRKKTEDTLRIIINDNGKGRSQQDNSVYQTKLHKSKGLKNCSKAFELIQSNL